MEVKIGVQHAPRELIVETDTSPEDFEAKLADAVTNDGILAFTDIRGRRIAVPGSKIAYVEIGSGTLGTVGYR